MTISELIERLEALKAEHGDEDVYAYVGYGTGRVTIVRFDPLYGVVVDAD